MKKGHSKNRHLSNGNNKSCKRTANRGGGKRRKLQSANEQIAEKSFKWSRIGLVIQLTDLLIDKVPRLIKWLFYLLEMG